MEQTLTIANKDNTKAMTLNLSALIAPITPDQPSGEDIRYDEVVDQIKEARRFDDPLDQGEWQTDLKTADWRQVDRLCRKALSEKSKDLQIAVWLVEAWVHIHGFAGFGAGIELITQMLKDFWPTLHPQIEDNDLDYRVGPLTFLNEKLPHVVFQVPLCDPDTSNGYHFYHWEEAQLLGNGQNIDKEQKKRRETMIAEGKVSGEAFSAATNASSLSYYRNLAKQLDQARQALVSLDEAVTELFAPDPPGFNQLMEAIERCGRVADRIFKEKSKSEVMPEEDEDMTEALEQAPEIPQVDANDSVADTPVTVSLQETQQHAIGDISLQEKGLWQLASKKLGQGRLKDAMDQLLSAAALAPSIREKNRFLLLLAKLCLKADRVDLARPIAEELYSVIETLNLEQWEHPSWIADVVETLYRCLTATDEEGGERVRTLFQKLCLLNVTKAAAYRLA